MDQDNSKGQDKRNWRERLGIGAQGQKDLPKISDDFKKPTVAATAPARPVGGAKPAPRPTASAVKPAPMAPRANPKPATPVAPDKLAERLRSQREASTKLAEQRVQIARQRATETPVAQPKQVPVPAPPPVQSGPKPKFTFAEEGGEGKPNAPVVRSVGVPPPAIQPQLAPARPPLGGMAAPPIPPPGMNTRPPLPPPPASQSYAMPPQQAGYLNGYQPAPVPPYRPIDPSTGYAPQPGYVPQQRGFTAPPPSQFNVQQTGPRLNLPPRPETMQRPPLPGAPLPHQDYSGPNMQSPGFSVPPRMTRPPLRGPAPGNGEQGDYEDEFFDESPAPRGARPTRDDYQQAYREAEYGYEEEETGSRTPLKLALALLMAVLLAGAGIWGYIQYGKPLMTGEANRQEAPLVAPPSEPVKIEAEQKAPDTPAVAATPSKKQIYDRIVGDQEVLGGDVSPAIEQPAAIPEPADTNSAPAEPQPGNGATDDAAPLPIPPPPGGTNGQQGALEVPSEKQSAETITPAAGESQAAVASADSNNPIADEQSASRSLALPPAPGEQLASEPAVNAPPTPVAEQIEDPVAETQTSDEKPEVVKKVVEKKKPKIANEKSLGSKPVVLVAPSKKPKVTKPKSEVRNQTALAETANADGGLYGTADNAQAVVEPAPVTPVETPKPKKKTLADLFRSSDNPPAQQDDRVATIDADPPVEPEVAKKPVAEKKPVVEKPVQVASAGDGFVAQLASFRSRDEASREFSRLKAKHSSVLGGFSPVISEAIVGGSTRFRLSVGSMANKAEADAVCSSLLSRGERDCLVKKR